MPPAGYASRERGFPREKTKSHARPKLEAQERARKTKASKKCWLGGGTLSREQQGIKKWVRAPPLWCRERRFPMQAPSNTGFPKYTRPETCATRAAVEPLIRISARYRLAATPGASGAIRHTG